MTIENNVMRHEYKTLSDDEKYDIKTIKDRGLNLYTHLNYLERQRGSHEISIAKTKIEEAVMWAVKHITEPDK